MFRVRAFTQLIFHLRCLHKSIFNHFLQSKFLSCLATNPRPRLALVLAKCPRANQKRSMYKSLIQHKYEQSCGSDE